MRMRFYDPRGCYYVLLRRASVRAFLVKAMCGSPRIKGRNFFVLLPFFKPQGVQCWIFCYCALNCPENAKQKWRLNWPRQFIGCENCYSDFLILLNCPLTVCIACYLLKSSKLPCTQHKKWGFWVLHCWKDCVGPGPTFCLLTFFEQC